jgi:hypothetical protein
VNNKNDVQNIARGKGRGFQGYRFSGLRWGIDCAFQGLRGPHYTAEEFAY